MDADEKAMVAKAAALMGTTMAGFVRVAAKEKAQSLLARETRLMLTGVPALDEYLSRLAEQHRRRGIASV